jgi:hypothetical protein
MERKYYVGAAVIVGLLLGAGGWFLFAQTANAPALDGGSSMAQGTTTTDGASGVSVEATGDVTVQAEPGNNVPPPKIDRSETRTAAASSTFSADVQAALKSQINTYVAELIAAPTRVDLWLKFGVVRKIAGDYQGAVEAWTYAAKAGPSPVNYVAYGNLGDLYLNFVHDYAKAENAYKAALALQPENADYQAGLKAAQQAKAGQ